MLLTLVKVSAGFGKADISYPRYRDIIEPEAPVTELSADEIIAQVNKRAGLKMIGGDEE